MNSQETIELLARMQGRYLTPARETCELKQDVPRILIWDASGAGSRKSWRISGDGFLGHDNEARMIPLCFFLQTQVLPLVTKDADISGHFNHELHDSYTYLNKHPREYYDNCMTFSKFADHTRAIVVPDMYQMGGYGLMGTDAMSWEQKLPKVFGAYTTTGDRDPLRNERIQTCIQSLEYPDACTLRITKVAQMNLQDVLAKCPKARSVMSPFVSHEEQLRHKCILSMKGNTAAWDLPWLLSSNSLMLQKYHNEINWFSPLLLDGTHYRRCHSLEQVLSQAKYYYANPAEAMHMTRNANQFVKDFMAPPSRAVLYWKSLLEEMAFNRP